MAKLDNLMRSTTTQLSVGWNDLPTRLQWFVGICTFFFVIQVAFIASHLTQLISHVLLTGLYFATITAVASHRRSKMNRLLSAIDRSNLIVKFCPGGVIKSANPLFCEAMEYEAEELVGNHHEMLVLERTKDSAKYRYFWKALGEGKPWHGTYERVTKTGKSVWVVGSYTPIKDDAGKVYEIVKVARDVTDQIELQIQLQTKNTYLEHAAKILRHDMHSGINTYIPRGVKSLERRLPNCICKRQTLDMPLRLIKEGLAHTQKVYAGVKEFTNLVKPDAALQTAEYELKGLLEEYLDSTAYRKQVVIEDLPTTEVNGPLFCTAVDNLIRNGLKYNDSSTKMVTVKALDGGIAVIDNGRGMSQKEFEKYSKPYVRKEGQVEAGSGLGLNICIAILREHGFAVTCEKLATGTLIRIQTND